MILAKASKVRLSRVKVITEKIEFILCCHRFSFFQQEQHLFKELGDVSNKRQPLDVEKNPEKTTAHIECGLWRGFAFNQMLLQWKKSFCFVLLRTTCSLYWDDPKNNPSWQFTSERNGTWLVRHLSRCKNIWSPQNINWLSNYMKKRSDHLFFLINWFSE